MDELIAKLEETYCPPLDRTLVRAIFSDFDHPMDPRVEVARTLLETLKFDAVFEQQTDFDASGSSGLPNRDRSNFDQFASQFEDTNSTNLSNSFWSVGMGQHSTSFSGLPSDSTCLNEPLDDVLQTQSGGTEASLCETFPGIKPSFVAFTLKKCNGNFHRAVDELLNHASFADEPMSGKEMVPTKGIDAFFEVNNITKVKKKRPKKSKAKQGPTGDDAHISSPEVPKSVWQTSTKDIAFLTSKTKLPRTLISSVYHHNGASMPKTISTIIERNIKDTDPFVLEDSVILQNAADLAKDFPSVDFPEILALIRLTHPSTASAHELAKILASPIHSKEKGGIEVIPRYAPIDLNPTPPPTPSTQAFAAQSYIGNSTTLSTARAYAFSQAQASYRKANSSNHMGGAAAYYSQVARDFSSALSNATAADADALVATQSSATKLDLHGVTVKDALRITSEKVAAWWAGLGEKKVGRNGRERVVLGMEEGYRIVTGVGKHSEGGVAKVGPAVTKMLLNEGWKVEVGRGELVVIGISKK
ncbi:hypothetical protein M501DRAFT_986452 [Patellaria atrata CBS 101060]|uniref:Smr domain-containing protein n=1 Tax=Patellaria atrata CBS 101060 TaxID=1346257 RepID=A0A9P4S7R0_9PEZI|nr:hypothetical protein M501DRAFT_986452 [Patellaria atrata CBS 101060]